MPYLRFLGMLGSGKTRASETVGSVCCRALALGGATTPAAIYRLVDTTGGTLVIDETDSTNGGVGSLITSILNSGYQTGKPVTRMDKDGLGNFVSHAFDAYGPKILNGRQPFKDAATESRCLVHYPSPTSRADIPKQLPPAFNQEALQLRNQLLQWRFDVLDTIQCTDADYADVQPRTIQIASPLLVIASQIEGKEGARYKEALNQLVYEVERNELEERRSTIEATLLQKYIDFRNAGSPPTCGLLAQMVIDDQREHNPGIERTLSAQTAGAIFRELGFTKRHSNKGAIPTITEARLRVACKRYGIDYPDDSAAA